MKIVDYGMGNLASVVAAITHIGGQAQIVNDPEDLRVASHVILPGVGSFANAMKNLDEQGWSDALREYVGHGHLMGICLGMHLLAGTGNENGVMAGLNLIPGKVINFEDKLSVSSQTELCIPHVGWNEVCLKNHDEPILKNIEDKTDFYFVHSYIFEAEYESDIVATTPYGVDFTSMVRRENVCGAQFHPEKSGNSGLQMLKNFGELR